MKRRQAPGSWSKKVILAALKSCFATLGHFPTQKELKEQNRADLSAAISKYGGFNKFAGLMGYKPARRTDGYWTKTKTLKELTEIEKSIGRPPTQLDLQLAGRGDLVSATRQHGGFKNVWAELKRIPKGYYAANDGHLMDSCLECYVDNYLFRQHVPHKVHPLISLRRKYRADFRVGDYWIEILGYPDIPKYSAYYSRVRKKKSLYKQLGLKTIFFEFNDFRHKTLVEIEKIIKSKLPLNAAPVCRRRGGRAGSILPNHYWSYFPTMIKILKPITERLGRFPTDVELDNQHLSGVRHAIYRYPGGRAKLARLLRCTVLRKPRNYWTKNQTIRDLKVFSAELGHFPKQKDFRRHGRNNLCSAVYKHGTLTDLKGAIA